MDKQVLHPKRKKLHKKIIDYYLNKHQPSSKEPVIHFILGSIGSGKTSSKEKIFQSNKESSSKFLYINFDDIKLRLPEYEILKELNPKQAAQFVQSESAKIAGMLRKKAIKKKVDILYEKNIRRSEDKTLHLKHEIEEAQKNGYHVSLNIIFANNYRKVLERVEKRYKEYKRYVPEKDVKDTFKELFPNLNLLFSKIGGYLVSFYLNDNQVTFLGQIYVHFKKDKTKNQNLEPIKSFFIGSNKDQYILKKENQYEIILSKKKISLIKSKPTRNQFKKLNCFKNIL